MDNSQKSSFWHWLTPILISLAVTGGGIAMFAGGLNARMIEVESKNTRFDDRLEKITNKLDSLATKEDLKEFKQDVKERIATKR